MADVSITAANVRADDTARTTTGVAGASLDGQPLTIALTGLVTIGGGLTAGAAYYLSDTPGGICPAADLGTGEYSVILGLARSASVLSLRIQESGVALA
jgi:hypothetical protein